MSTTSPITVTNLTRGTVIVSSGRVAARFWSRFRGLMLARPLPPGAGLVIVPCSSIHTQFMRFPIDVLYANKEDVIVGIDRNLHPWRIGRLYKKVHYVVELPAGAAEGCQVGDKLEIKGRETGGTERPLGPVEKKGGLNPFRLPTWFPGPLPSSQLAPNAPPAQAAAG